jgi:uncharacterized protein
MNYLPRIVDSELKQALLSIGGVLIEGPRGCGKTSTAEMQANSVVRLDVDENAQMLAKTDPQVLLDREPPLLLDEWQTISTIWNQARYAIDQRQSPGQFILTGSTRQILRSDMHTGAMRFLRMRMRTMSLFESGRSSGDLSLSELMRGSSKSAISPLSFSLMVEEVCRSGFPSLIGKPIQVAQRHLSSYIKDLLASDFKELTGQIRNPARIKRVFQTLSRNVGSEASVAAMCKEVNAQDVESLVELTLERYIQAFRDLHIVDDLPPWSPHLRSSYVVRKSPKRYFVDPGLAAAALGATPAKLNQDMKTLGFMFENLVLRDLRIYAQAMEAEVSHYRDSGGLEVDAIVETAGGTWGAFEVKLGTHAIDEAAANLLKLAKLVNQETMGKPVVLAVITAGQYSYVREDGVQVIAIGTLGP